VQGQHINMAAVRAKILRILTKYDAQINARLPPVGQRFWNHAAGIRLNVFIIFRLSLSNIYMFNIMVCE
jgi:hypothetical protein